MRYLEYALAAQQSILSSQSFVSVVRSSCFWVRFPKVQALRKQSGCRSVLGSMKRRVEVGAGRSSARSERFRREEHGFILFDNFTSMGELVITP